MFSPLKTTVLAAAICATSLACLPAANADEFYTYYPSYDLYRLPNGSLAVNPAAVANNVYGITAPAYNYGMTAPAYRYAPVTRTYGITAPAYSHVATVRPQPGTMGWYRYCSDRYRTFDPRTGTFTGYDGRQHFCR